MIEVQESYSRDGVHAVVTGGKTQVIIRPAAATVVKGHYTDSIHMMRPNYWTRDTYLPEGYYVIRKGVSTRVTSYARAVELAVYHAKRR